jgi:hypothetical protein
MSSNGPRGLGRDSRGLPTGETVLTWRRHHWIVLLRLIALPLIVTLISFVAFLILTGGALANTTADTGGLGLVLGGLLLVIPIFGLLWTLYSVWDWASDWFILTDRRIIVRESKPLRREERREIPIGKVQNATSAFPGWWQKSLNFGRLTIDTSGLGVVVFNDVGDPDGLRAQVMAQQKLVQAAGQNPRQQYRQEMVRHILYGTPAPAAPTVTAVQSSPRLGFDTFNSLFPFKPQRDGLTVIWHKHWWYLLRAELVPVFVVLLYEGTNLALAILAGLLGATQNPVGDFLAVLRPFVWIFALLFALYQWEDWRNDYYEVREDRVIDVEALPLGLFQETKETELRRITDIRNDMRGLGIILNFGNIVIKTPGESTAFTFDGVPNPRSVLGEIMDRIEAMREREQAQWARDIQDWLKVYTGEIQSYQAWQAQQQPPPPVGPPPF